MKTAIVILLATGESVIVFNAAKNLIKELRGKKTDATKLDRFTYKYGHLCIIIGSAIGLAMHYCL